MWISAIGCTSDGRLVLLYHMYFLFIYIFICGSILYVDTWICGVMMSLYENVLRIVRDCNTRGMGKMRLKDSKMLDIYCTFERVL